VPNVTKLRACSCERIINVLLEGFLDAGLRKNPSNRRGDVLRMVHSMWLAVNSATKRFPRCCKLKAALGTCDGCRTELWIRSVGARFVESATGRPWTANVANDVGLEVEYMKGCLQFVRVERESLGGHSGL